MQKYKKMWECEHVVNVETGQTHEIINHNRTTGNNRNTKHENYNKHKVTPTSVRNPVSITKANLQKSSKPQSNQSNTKFTL